MSDSQPADDTLGPMLEAARARDLGEADDPAIIIAELRYELAVRRILTDRLAHD